MAKTKTKAELTAGAPPEVQEAAKAAEQVRKITKAPCCYGGECPFFAPCDYWANGAHSVPTPCTVCQHFVPVDMMKVVEG